MYRTKLKTTKVGKLGHRDISSFFSPEKPKDSLSAAITLTKIEPQIKKDISSPSKRKILGVLENILPKSPDLLLSIPETPDSQIRPDSTTTTTTRDPCQHSPLCRSPSSRGQGLTKGIRKEGRSEKRANESACSVKRLFSPSEECCNAKRPRTTTLQSRKTSSLKETRPVLLSLKTVCVSRDSFHSNRQKCLSADQEETFVGSRLQVILPKPVSVRGISPHLLKSPRKPNEEEADDQEELPFTGITEPKAKAEKVCLTQQTHNSSDSEIHTLQADTHTHSLQDNPDTPQMKDGMREGEEATAMTSSDAGGENAGMTASVSLIDEMMEESWFDDQMDLSTGPVREEKANKHRKVPDHVILSGGLNNRYWVLDVEEKPSHKILTISCSKSLHPIETCLLKDGWETTPVSWGDVVHLEGQCDAGSWIVNREKGFLVLLPDVLISGTSISNSIRCMRRAVLGDIFKTFDGGSKQMLNGTMVHEVFQKAAMAKDFSTETLSHLADQELCSPQHLGAMYSLGLTREEMEQELRDYLPSLKHWANEYLDPSAPKAISLKLNGGASLKGNDSSAAVVTVTELADIEDNVWSPRFGLKGKIDVTTRVRVQRVRKDGLRTQEEMIMPLELKTGKETNSIEHRSQVVLYTLMSMQRYEDAGAGFLLYLKTGNLHPVVAGHMDRRELLKLRNTLAHYLGKSVEKGAERSRLTRLPEILTNRQTCQYCPQRRNCALYERVVESSSSDLSHDAVQDLLLQETGHLSLPHLSYFSHWLLLCSLEAVTMETKNGRRHVWLQTAEEREKSGQCIGNLRLDSPVSVQSEGVFLHHFLRRGVASQGFSSGLADGDRIVVSDQDVRLVGLATGYLRDIKGASVSCTLDRDLSKFSDVMFRLDHDEGVIGLGTHLANLSRLMENCPDSDRLRELVVDLRPPEFIPSLSSVLPREAKDTVANMLKGLNKPQKQAMKKVLLSKDFTLIVGMPGTGKTTTICTLVRILHACGFSVLLSSYTHSAVDNILLKLKRFRVGFLRLGRGQKVHPDILPYTEESGRKNGVPTLSELEHLYNKELVVGTTCMGTKHPIFTRRKFDFCIVDEASQISQPVCLGPLFHAKKFVLVGDHQQLPPIVQNQEARSMGMDESLFKRLELHSEAVVQLNVQYRMNRKIMSLSNSLMYDGRLECGSEKTASALLSLPFLISVQSDLSAHSKTHPQLDLDWIQAALLPSNPVCFLDTSLVPALETVDKGGISNHTEASLIHTLLSLLIKAGCKSSDIGVIAPYRQQLKSISALLRSSEFSGVEVNTVDRYQGRDKSLIVLSFVRSTSEEGNLGELLKDWRRLNVAVTRAKHKLLMVGSASTLGRYAPLEKLLSHLQQESMMIKLPPAAHQALPNMHL